MSLAVALDDDNNNNNDQDVAYRGRQETVYVLLDAIRNRSPYCRKWGLKSTARMDYIQMSRILDNSIACGFVHEHRDGGPGVEQWYSVTEKGLRYMHLFREMIEDLQPIKDYA